jgi:hypothetical protein
MPFLADKQTIMKEIEALKQNGYSINVQAIMFKDGISIPTIDIAPKGQIKGVTIIYQDNSLRLMKDDYAVFLTYLNTKELNEFIQKFPKHIAPIIAEALESEPPEPNDKIHNNYQLKY